MQTPSEGSAPERLDLLILGLGNVLCSDDGVGPAAVAALLREHRPPPGVAVLDGGTLGLSLLPWVESARNVVLVDAVREDAPPGALVELVGDEVPPAVWDRLSPHQIGVADLLDGARWRGRSPERLLLLGLVPASLSMGLGLSAPVRAALPGLVRRVAETAEELGHPLQPGIDHETDGVDRDRRPARVLGL
jgi:hydrogenase maturation protease